jgi:hypothetical protein
MAARLNAGYDERLVFVMPGLLPGIHVFLEAGRNKTWMAGTSPAMTKIEC